VVKISKGVDIADLIRKRMDKGIHYIEIHECEIDGNRIIVNLTDKHGLYNEDDKILGVKWHKKWWARCVRFKRIENASTKEIEVKKGD
jgi:hypothetical protein